MVEPKQWYARVMVVITIAVAALLGANPGALAQTTESVMLFTPPIPLGDSIWMAQKKGYFKDEKLDVTIKWWSSGTLAMQTFQSGKDGKRGFGDFNAGGDLPAVNFWQNMGGEFAIIAAIERDGDGYNGIAKAEIKTGKDLKGKVIATRVGSTAAWFVSEYLKSQGMTEADVTIKNLEPQIMPSALDRGDIDAFFIWEPYGSESLKISGNKVHRLTNGGSYFNGYYLLGAWKWYLRDHPDVAPRLLRAIDRGRAYAEKHKEEVLEFARTEFSVQDTTAIEKQWGFNRRPVALDKQVWDDFQRLNTWMQEKGLGTREFDPKSLFDPKPLQAVLPDRVAPEFLR
jgi:ABC-type nitrate/sulfonate/bicarbonate transport system substrate-binding protein